MKYLFALFSILVLYNCSTRTKWKLDSKQPIVDHPTSYERNKQTLSVFAAIKKQNEQTLVLINDKISTLEKFHKLLKKGKINAVKIIKNEKEIEQLNYSYAKVKTVIIATKK